MMTVKTIESRDFADRAVFESLYSRSFPSNEAIPLNKLLMDRSGATETVAFYIDDVFAGFATILHTASVAHIIYLAVTEEKRGRGIGSAALALLHERIGEKRVIVDVEAPTETAPNRDERLRRIRFYERAGYRETEVRYNWRGEDYVILCRGGEFTSSDWDAFWREIEQKRDARDL